MYSLQPGLGLACIWNRAFNDGKGRIQSGSLIFFVIEWVLSMRPDFTMSFQCWRMLPWQMLLAILLCLLRESVDTRL